MASGLSGLLVHADERLLVVDKPAGLLAVPGRGPHKQDCLSARVQRVWPDALVVHRLDMATSGLIAFGRGVDAQRSLSGAFAERRVEKRYEAIVAGRPAEAPDGDGWSTINLPIAADWPNRPLQKVDHERGSPSVTRWKTMAFDKAARTSRLELEPFTGRSHQLRVHLLALGHPILGDALYAPEPWRSAAQRLLLHATRLALPHPATGEMMSFASPPPF